MSRILSALLVTCFLLPAGCVDDDIPPTLKAVRELKEIREKNNPKPKFLDPEPEDAASDEPAQEMVSEDLPATGSYQVEFITTVGRFVVDVHREWSPIGAERFHQLVEDEFFDDCGFFRVVPGFVVQFGLPADPNDNRKWESPIKDDPVTQTNARGTLTFATSGPNSRTTQLFINYADNSNLDGMGFSPFGKVIEGMDVVYRINREYGEDPQQPAITSQGNAYLSREFPNLTYIQTARIIEPAE